VPAAPHPSNRSLLLPYALPYVAYVGIAMIPADYLAVEWNYACRIALSAAALAACFRRYVPLRGPGSPATSIGVGVLAGLAGTALWVVLKAPLVPAGGEPWGEAAFALRLLASAGLVPVFEELLMRGFVLRFAYQWDLARRAGAQDPFGEALNSRSIQDVAAGAATPLAVGIATLIFALGHGTPEFPASLAYGLLMCGLWIGRKDLLSCVTAHAVTNAALAFYVRSTGQWALW
jgi:membrane protease YdiL (CAAX protease family)